MSPPEFVDALGALADDGYPHHGVARAPVRPVPPDAPAGPRHVTFV
jgi:hypothetical protein